MSSRTAVIIIYMLVSMVVFGCTGGGGVDPLAPRLSPGSKDIAASNSQTHLWGFYDISIDPVSLAVEASLNRNVMFAANVVTFLNSNPANLGFTVNSAPVKAGFIDVDLDISISHPFSNLPQYNGYDVRGIFIGEGNAKLDYNPDLRYAKNGMDQMMIIDPDPLDFPDDEPGGGPDGYTRWFNPNEFTTPGLFGYTPGKIATPGYIGTATLNPYKYFADGLGAYESAFEFLAETSYHGLFSSGSTNTRNYYLSFPKVNGIRFNYAVVADWSGEAEEFHPSNAPEPVSASVTITDNVYYTDATLNGGWLILDISVFDWDANVTSDGIMEDYLLTVESSVLSNPYTFNAGDMTPVDGTDAYSTFHFEIQADDVTKLNGNEVWLIAEVSGHDYTNEFNAPNDAGEDTLAAFFRYDLNVSETPPNYPPYIEGLEDDIIGNGDYEDHVNFYDDNVTYTVLFEDKDPEDIHTFTWYITQESLPGPADIVSMPVNWSLYEPGDYNIYVKVGDGSVFVNGGPWPIHMNTLPEIISGVDGETDPLLVRSETYTVDAYDPDLGQTLTYEWTVVDQETYTAVPGYDGVPGDGNGSLVVDWKAIGAEDNHDYNIYCNVSDGMVEVPADTLSVTTTVNLYYGDYTVDDGDMFVQYAYYNIDGRKWQYDSYENIWEESEAVPGSFNRYARTRLSTPALNIPAGISEVRMDIRQWAGTIDTGDVCYLQYATTGANFATLTSWSYIIHGSSAYDIVETFIFPSSMINKPNAAVGFYFSSNFDATIQGVGWNIRELRIYIVP